MRDSQPPITEFTRQYRWLSNFESSVITYHQIMFPTVEHAYQAFKTRDHMWFNKIAQADGARQAKFFGRQAPIRPDWDEVKDDIMLDCIRLKFHIPEFKEKLLATGTREIIEGNYWGDIYWGVCRGRGQNKLGRIIMRVREELYLESTLSDGVPKEKS